MTHDSEDIFRNSCAIIIFYNSFCTKCFSVNVHPIHTYILLQSFGNYMWESCGRSFRLLPAKSRTALSYLDAKTFTRTYHKRLKTWQQNLFHDYLSHDKYTPLYGYNEQNLSSGNQDLISRCRPDDLLKVLRIWTTWSEDEAALWQHIPVQLLHPLWRSV